MILVFIALIQFSRTVPLSITMRCDVCTRISGCKQCLVFNGGPLSNAALCADSDGGCRVKGSQSVLTFGCNCQDKTCSYSVVQVSYLEQGCANDDDSDWPYTQSLLDLLLLNQNGGIDEDYDWCNGACAMSDSTIILLVILGVVVIIGLVGLVYYYKRRNIKKVEQVDNNDSYQLV